MCQSVEFMGTRVLLVDTHREARSFRNSTRISRGTYDPDTKVLELVFRRDRVKVQYLDVPSAVWAGLLDAKSPGLYVTTVLERFKYRRL
jgi:hypothetical protein